MRCDDVFKIQILIFCAHQHTLKRILYSINVLNFHATYFCTFISDNNHQSLSGDFKEVWVIVKSNAAVGGVALCIAVPAILFLRFPFMLKFAVGR